MPLNKDKKQKLRKLLGALRPEEKTDLVADELREELAVVASRVDSAPNYMASINELRDGFKSIVAKISTKLEGVADKDELSKLQNEYLNGLTDLDKRLKKITLDIRSEVDEQFFDTKNTFTADLKKLRLELLNKQGGGNANRQIRVAGSVMSLKYTDINFQDSSTVGWIASDDNTNKRVNIQASVLSGGGATPAGDDSQVQYNEGGTTLGASSVFVWKKATNRLGVGTANPDKTLHAEYSGSETTATIFPVRVSHVTSGTAASIGVGQEFELENADAVNFIAGSQEFKMTANGDGAESADYVLDLISGGSKAERFRVKANGSIITGVWDATPIALTKGGTGKTSISSVTAWVANADNVLTEIAPDAGQSIRVNAGHTAWEAYTPSSGGGGAGIGSVVTNGTDGSLLFVNPASTLGQDNTSLFWDNTNKKMGIGNNTKLVRLTVKQQASIIATGSSNTSNSTTVTGVNTKFLTEFGPGDRITTPYIASTFGVSSIVQIEAIASDTSMTVRPALQGNFNHQSIIGLKAIQRWDSSHGSVVGLISDEGYLGIGTTVFKPLAPFHIANTNGLKISASGTGRGALLYYDDPGGSIVFRRSDIADTLTFTPSSGSMDFSGATNLLGFRLNSGSLNFISSNGGGSGVITFGRRVSDNNVACGAEVRFWPTSTQTTPAAAVMAPGGTGYRSKWMPDGAFEPSSSSTIGMIVRGVTSQTANLHEWRSVSSSVVAQVSSGGRIGTSIGTTSILAKVGGTVYATSSTIGNITTGEDDLMSYSSTGNSLDSDGASLRFRASGTIANNANAKRLRVKYGSTTVLDTGAAGIPTSVAIQWVADGEIIRTGASTQKCNARLTTDNATFQAFSGYSTAGETLSGAVNLKLTGEATGTNDIVQETMTVHFEPAP